MCICIHIIPQSESESENESEVEATPTTSVQSVTAAADAAEPAVVGDAPYVTSAHGANEDALGEAAAQQLAPIVALDTDTVCV